MGFRLIMRSDYFFDNGSSVLGKAVLRNFNRVSSKLYCHEAVVASQLPSSLSIPQLLHSWNDDDWAYLIFVDQWPPANSALATS